MQLQLTSFKPKTFLLIFFLLISLLPNVLYAKQITLLWDPNTEPDLAGYNLYHRLAGQPYDYAAPIWSGTSNTSTLDIIEPGEHHFVVRAFTSDNTESGDSNETIYYLANQEPSANAGTDQMLYEGNPVAMDGSASFDPDDGIAFFLWSQLNGPVVALSDFTNPMPTFTAPLVDSDVDLVFQLNVTDNGGLSSIDTVTITVKDRVANMPPLADAGNDQSAHERDVVTLSAAESSDPEGEIETYSWTQTAGTLVELSDPTAMEPSFTCPEVGSTGETLTFQLTITDSNGASASDSVNIAISDIIDPTLPLEISQLKAASGRAYNVFQNLDDGATCYIDRGYIYSEVPEFLKGATFIQTANNDKTRINDPFLTFQANIPVTVYVAFDNRAQLPTWMDAFTDSGVDLRTDTAFSIYQKAYETGSVQLGGNGHRGSMYTVMIVGEGILPPPNEMPVADAGSDQTAEERSLVLLSGVNSSDPDGDIASWKWVQTAGTPVELSNPTAMESYFTCPDVPAGGETLTFHLTVTDYNGASTSDSVNITVNDIAYPTAQLEMTNLWNASGRKYQIVQNLDNGSTCYIDRGYIYSKVPEFLKGATFIQTANNDKTRTNNPFLTFQVDTSVTVYVAYDNRKQLPTWMNGFTDTGFDMKTDVTFSIYEKTYEKGSIELGGNGHNGSMYTVIVEAN